MTILIADDDDLLRELVEIVLTSAGYKVSAHPNGRLAWESLQKTGADMAVHDINMPEMDGLELLDCIRADDRFKEMPVMILTSNRGASDQAHGYERGADDYLTKPFENDMLLKRVKLLEQAFPKNG